MATGRGRRARSTRTAIQTPNWPRSWLARWSSFGGASFARERGTREPAGSDGPSGERPQDGGAVKLDQLMTTVREAIMVRRVFAEPYQKEGVTVITAATVAGGGVAEAGTTTAARKVRAAGSA